MSAAQENTVTDPNREDIPWQAALAARMPAGQEPFGHAMIDGMGRIVGVNLFKRGEPYNYTVADLAEHDRIYPSCAPHTGMLIYSHPQPTELAEQQGVELPRLPEAFESEFASPGASPVSVYTAEQMQDYARAALAARQPVCGTCGEVIQPDALTGTTCVCARQPQAGKYDQSAEDRFEQFVQAEIARSPDALRELGEYLGRVLDEDEFPMANSLLLQLATEYASTPAPGIDLVPAGWTIVQGEDLRIVGPIEGPGGMVMDKPGRSLESRLLYALATALIKGQRDAAPGVANG